MNVHGCFSNSFMIIFVFDHSKKINCYHIKKSFSAKKKFFVLHGGSDLPYIFISPYHAWLHFKIWLKHITTHSVDEWVCVVLAGIHSCHFYFVLAIQPKLNSSQIFSSSILCCNDQNLWFLLKLWFSPGLNEMGKTSKLVSAFEFFFLRKGKTEGEGAISCLFYKNLPLDFLSYFS